MATYYVFSGATGANNGTSWTDAYTAFGSAVTAATTAGDIIKVHYTHTETLAADTTYTFGANLSVVSVNKDSADAPTEMGASGVIGNASFSILLAQNGFTVYMYGLHFKVTGTVADNLHVGSGATGTVICEKCYLELTNNAAASEIRIGPIYASANYSRAVLNNCNLALGGAAQLISLRYDVSIIGGSYTGVAVTGALFKGAPGTGGPKIFSGFDLTAAGTSSKLVDTSIVGNDDWVFSNCKLPAGIVAIVSNGVLSDEVYEFNCASGDVNYAFRHTNGLGETVAVTTPYADDGALYDGTNHVTWKITTTADASFGNPYLSPWIEKYNSTLTAITPYLEILRDGSTTAFTDAEVWGEFSYQGTTGFPLAVFVNDRMTPLGTAAAQAAGVGLAGWTGEAASAWSGKLAPGAAVTPAEIGHLRARICVGLASATVYVDPKIRV